MVLLVDMVGCLVIVPSIGSLTRTTRNNTTTPRDIGMIRPAADIGRPIRPAISASGRGSTRIRAVSSIIEHVYASNRDCMVAAIVAGVSYRRHANHGNGSCLGTFIAVTDPIGNTRDVPSNARQVNVLNTIRVPFGRVLLMVHGSGFCNEFIGCINRTTRTNFTDVCLANITIGILYRFMPTNMRSHGPFAHGSGLCGIISCSECMCRVMNVRRPASPILINTCGMLVGRVVRSTHTTVTTGHRTGTGTTDFITATVGSSSVPFW